MVTKTAQPSATTAAPAAKKAAGAKPTQRRATTSMSARKKPVVAAEPAQRRATASTPARKKPVVAAEPAQRRATASTRARKKPVVAAEPAQRRAAAEVEERNGRRRPVMHALVAAERAVQRNSLQVRLPIAGEVQLPAPDEIAYIGGVAVLAMVGMLEWPVAILLGVGHGLAGLRHRKLLRSFGEALEEA